jgi:hypothetical protein
MAMLQGHGPYMFDYAEHSVAARDLDIMDLDEHSVIYP